jgi:secreted trypsin-like serine protease
MHSDWNPQVQSFDGDISLYELEQTIQFTNYIQPICWWQSTVDPQANFGIVVGYGRSENEARIHENKPKMIQVPIQSQESCFLREPSLAKLSSNRTFCGGRGDGTGVCSGDSGGGLVVNVNGVFYLRGIVSSSLIKDFSCDVSNYAVFTNILR